IVGMLLESRLHPDVPLGGDFMGCYEDPLYVLGHLGQAMNGATAKNLVHELIAVEAPLLGDLLEDRIDEPQRPLTDFVDERECEARVDTRRAFGGDADCAGRGNCRRRRVAERGASLISAPFEIREWATLLGELDRFFATNPGDRRHQSLGE